MRRIKALLEPLIEGPDDGRLLFARERGAQVLIGEPWTRGGRHDVLVLQDGTVPPGPRIGLVPQGTEARSGLLRGQRYRAEGP